MVHSCGTHVYVFLKPVTGTGSTVCCILYLAVCTVYRYHTHIHKHGTRRTTFCSCSFQARHKTALHHTHKNARPYNTTPNTTNNNIRVVSGSCATPHTVYHSTKPSSPLGTTVSKKFVPHALPHV